MKRYQISSRPIDSLFIGLLLLGGLASPAFAQVLTHRYTFNETAGATNVRDSVGTANGTLIGTGTFDGSGNLNLPGVDGYVDLGPNLITGYTNLTIEAWGTFGTNAAWATLFGFGDTDPATGTGAYGIDFSPHSGPGACLFEVYNTDPGTAGAQGVSFAPPLDGQGKMQVAAVYDPQVPIMAIYVNGSLQASSTAIAIPFADITNAYSYIGQSLYVGDPFLNATLNEFRIYAGVLSPFQIALDAAAGPSSIITNAVSLTNINLTVPSPVIAGQTVRAVVAGDYQNIKGVSLQSLNPTLQSGDTSILAVGSNLQLNAIMPGTTTLIASYGGLSATQSVTVIPLASAHRYSFNDPAGSTTFADSVGTADGTVFGAASLDGNGHLVLPGGGGGNSTADDNYAALPPHLIDSFNAVTLEFWVAMGAIPTWGRLFDFGDTDASGNGLTVLDCAPNSGFSPAGVNFEVGPNFYCDATPPLVNWTGHAVFIFNPGQYLAVYTNGILMHMTTGVTDGMSAINTTHSYLGRSSWNGDPNGVQTIDELRIYNGVLPLYQIAIDAVSGPTSVITSLGAITNLHFAVPSPVYAFQQSIQATVTGDFQNAQGVNLAFANPRLQPANTNVLQFAGNLTLDIVGAGTTEVIATYGGLSATQTVTVVQSSLVLTHRYSFNDSASSTNFVDSVGNADGTLFGTASLDGMGHLVLTGGAGGNSPSDDNYAAVPPHLIDNYSAVTFEFWIALGAMPTWSRVFDFGDTEGGNGQNQIDCAPNDGLSPVGVNFEVPGANVNLPPPLVNWTGHLVCVFDPGQYLAIYTNGVLMGINNGVGVQMSALNTTHSYLGRSSWGDPNGVETYDEFRIYEGAMAPNQVAADYLAGPSNNIAVFGALTNLHLGIPSPVSTDQALPLQAAVTGDFQKAKGVNLTVANPALTSANTNILKHVGNLTLQIVGAGTTEVVATYGGLSATQTVTVLQSPLALTHRYSFTELAGSTNFNDSVGTAEGTLFGTASLDGMGHLVLPGGDGGNSTNDNYAALPPHLIDDYSAVTFEFWVDIATNCPTWGRLVDFGDTSAGGSGQNDIDCAPNDGFTPVGVNFEVDGAYNTHPAPSLVGFNGHLVLVFDPAAQYLAIYTNAVLFGLNSAVIWPMSNLNTTHSYLGRSSFLVDPNGAATIDEFRLYNGAMGPNQIAADYAAGPSNNITVFGALTNLHLTVPSPVFTGQAPLQAVVVGDFKTIQGVNLTTANPPLTSANTNVLQYVGNLTLQVVGAGTTEVIATYGGLSATQTVTVVQRPLLVTHRYSFNESAGSTTFADSVGSANGTVFGAASLDGSGHLVLPGGGGGNSTTDNYAALPPHLIETYTGVTFEFWVAFGSNPTWGRLFDFGNTDSSGNGQNQMDCAPNSGFGGINFEVPSAHIAVEPSLNNWAGHLALVYDPVAQYLAIYTNGVLMGMTTGVNYPLSELNTTHSYLGRSSWNGDANGVATIDELRIYNGVLPTYQIALDAAAGPSNTNTDLGALTKLHLAVPSPVYSDQLSVLATVTGDFQNANGVNLAFANPPLESANTNVVQSVGNLTLHVVAVGTTEVIATYGGLSATQTVTVVQSPLVLTHRYSFNESAGSTTFTDSVGNADGTVFGTASLDGNGHLVLPGGDGGNSTNNDNYAALPPHLIDSYSAVTFEFWVAIGAMPTWGRLVDFGDTSAGGSGQNDIDCAPNDGFSPVGINFEVDGAYNTHPSPPLANWTGYLVLVFDPTAQYLAVYTNAVLMGMTTGVNWPMSNLNTTHSYLGRSSFLGDPNGVATIDELRLYNGAMGLSQIAADYAAGPNTVTVPTSSPSLSIVKSDGNIVLAWPESASGYSVQTTSKLGAGASWGPPAGNPSPVATNGTYQVTLPIGAQAAFYRLVK
jgi:hypothetical protein